MKISKLSWLDPSSVSQQALLPCQWQLKLAPSEQQPGIQILLPGKLAEHLLKESLSWYTHKPQIMLQSMWSSQGSVYGNKK